MTLDEVTSEGHFWLLPIQKAVFLSELSRALTGVKSNIIQCLSRSLFLHKTAKTWNNWQMGTACNEAAFKLEKYMFKFSNRNVGKKNALQQALNYPIGWTWQFVSKNQYCTEGMTNTYCLWVLFWKLPLPCIIRSPLIQPHFPAQGDSCHLPEEPLQWRVCHKNLAIKLPSPFLISSSIPCLGQTFWNRQHNLWSLLPTGQ